MTFLLGGWQEFLFLFSCKIFLCDSLCKLSCVAFFWLNASWNKWCWGFSSNLSACHLFLATNPRQTDLISDCKLNSLCSTLPPPHLTLHLFSSTHSHRKYRAAHYRAFGCLWVTLPHIWDRHWAQYPDAFAVSVGCVRMSLTTHWNGAQAIWEACLSDVNFVDETQEDGVCHTLNWSMWQQPSLSSDCDDQSVALVKHSNGTIIKAGTQKQKPDTPVKQVLTNTVIEVIDRSQIRSFLVFIMYYCLGLLIQKILKHLFEFFIFLRQCI